MTTQINSLETLRDAMIANDAATLDRHSQWNSTLPAFGGQAPRSTSGVWSWDDERLLVGTCAADLRIVSREEW